MKTMSLACYFLATLLPIVSFVSGYYIHKNQTESELADVVDLNTKQIHSVAVVSATESFEADCLLQLLHAVNNEDFEVPNINTLTETLSFDDKRIVPSVEDEPDHTFEQVEMDQLEVDQCIRGFASGNLFQAELLINILKKLKDKQK